MEITPEQAVQFFGVTWDQLLMVAGMTYFIIEAMKGKFPNFFFGTAYTIAALLVSAFISAKMLNFQFATEWSTMLVLTVAAWLIPIGAHKARKNGGK